jgi:hypothetical protein
LTVLHHHYVSLIERRASCNGGAGLAPPLEQLVVGAGIALLEPPALKRDRVGAKLASLDGSSRGLVAFTAETGTDVLGVVASLDFMVRIRTFFLALGRPPRLIPQLTPLDLLAAALLVELAIPVLLVDLAQVLPLAEPGLDELVGVDPGHVAVAMAGHAVGRPLHVTTR